MYFIRTTLVVLALSLPAAAFSQEGSNAALYQAVRKGDTALVRQALAADADPNFVYAAGPWMKVNMLITAVNGGNIDVVKTLLAHQADVSWKDGFKTSALLYATGAGRKDLVELLLAHGADLHNRDGQGTTVLAAAKESKNKELIQFLEAKLKNEQ